MFEPYRVLDLTDERGLICGQILADLGADVIQVEPPGGSPARELGPFAGGQPHPERSLHWWSYARNKRSITLDLDSPAGRDRLRELARSAHFVIESAKPGVMAARGLAYPDLAALNPALIYVSITPFGQDGPKADYADSDLIVLAAGGPLLLTGDTDRPPVRVSVPQAYSHAGAEAALAALIAHHERCRSGLGQHVDVSAQAAVAVATQSTILATANGTIGTQRASGGLRVGPIFIRFIYPAKDGYVSITHLFGSTVGPATRRLMECVYEAGYCDEATRDKDWLGYTVFLLSGQESLEEFDRVKECVAAFTASRTCEELHQLAVERKLLLASVSNIGQVVENEHFAARGYWRNAPCPPMGAQCRYPGPFAQFSAAPIDYRRGAPEIGEHNDEILASSDAAPALVADRSVPVSAAPNFTAALDGVKILDLMWALAGPIGTRALADYGATVVRVESPTRTDICRTVAPFQNFQLDGESAVLFHNTNAGKLVISLDLTQPAARDVLLDLVRWADVVCEAFPPRVMRAWGLDYESLRTVKPDIIMLSTCLMGQTGPLAEFAGYGNLAAAVTGFYDLGGWPDRPPTGPWGAYTDYIAWRYNAIAVLAALEHRRRTGQGQQIDLAQAEAALHFLAPAILDYTVNGNVPSRAGNRDPQAVPHGVYPALGDDRWVAIAVQSDAQWRTLCEVMERAELAGDARFASAADRVRNYAELDAIVGAWTATREAPEVERVLQAREVPAHVVQDSPDLCADPALLQRGHFVAISHPEHGTTTVEASRFRLSRTPARADDSVPTFGRDNQRVLEGILGYDEEKITAVVAAGALG